MSRTIGIVGNPNCGKTTLFNALTGGNHRVGNWPGVTVEKKIGEIPLYAPSFEMATGRSTAPTTDSGSSADTATSEAPAAITGRPKLVDLPGIYSLNAVSQDEVVARNFLLSGSYDLIINIVDASNLERNLFLTLQLIEMRVPVLVVLNMMDLAESNGITIDPDHLSKHLDCPVVALQANQRRTVEALKPVLRDALDAPYPSKARVTYPQPVADQIARWRERLEPAAGRLGFHPEYAAVRLIEGDGWIGGMVERLGLIDHEEVAEVRSELRERVDEDLDIVVADGRYGFIHGVSRDVVTKKVTRESVTDRIDRVVMSRVLGIPVFLGAMYLVFWATIAVGGAFIDFFDIAVGTLFVDGLGALLESLSAPPWLVGILAGGVGAGIQTVSTFIPIIFMMFFMLSLLEDSGYMARAAFVMDRLMRWVGLPGKSFVPLLVGFGCTVPAISATRTLESRKDRFMTIFMAPFMSCGARLPVYALFAAALFPGRAGTVVFGLYMLGMILAIGTGLLLKRTLFQGEYSHFVMELPPYHAPRLGAILRLSWIRLRVFVKRAGITITMVVTILAVLNSLGTDGTFGNEDTDRSVLAGIGRTVTPVFEPMGIESDNWPATVGLFTGLFAKEAIVGTLSALYSQNDASQEEPFDLWGGLGAAFASIPESFAGLGGTLRDPLGTGIVQESPEGVSRELAVDNTLFSRMRSMFSPGAALAYLVFVLVYFPCVAALGAAIQEMGVGYGSLLAGYLTALAYILGVLVYQFTAGPEILPVIGAIAGLVAIGLLFALIGNRSRARQATA
jgi:ferrous iron transport protein B